MNFNLKNKVILFTGCTGVLGKAMVQYLAKEKATLLLVGRSEEKLSQLYNEIQLDSPNSQYYVCDILSEDSLNNLKSKIKDKVEGIDVLINAAGGNIQGAVITPSQNFNETSTEDLKKVMEINYLGTFLPCKVFVDILNTNASIINLSSMASDRPLTRILGYASSKAAVENFTKWLAIELAQKSEKKIRVNAIAPGFFLTEQNKQLLTNEDGSLSDRSIRILNNTPFQRFGTPEDLLGALHWLSSDASKFVTGIILPVDGGFRAYSGV
ncbi:MAG: SDR family oxidoreductase [Leadbetterella sp.]